MNSVRTIEIAVSKDTFNSWITGGLYSLGSFNQFREDIINIKLVGAPDQELVPLKVTIREEVQAPNNGKAKT